MTEITILTLDPAAVRLWLTALCFGAGGAFGGALIGYGLAWWEQKGDSTHGT